VAVANVQNEDECCEVVAVDRAAAHAPEPAAVVLRTSEDESADALVCTEGDVNKPAVLVKVWYSVQVSVADVVFAVPRPTDVHLPALPVLARLATEPAETPKHTDDIVERELEAAPAFHVERTVFHCSST
jgi:hypothetical protein